MQPSHPTIDRDFLDARARMLDLAAYLDRVERDDPTGDFRHQALLRCLPVLLAPGPVPGGRVKAILESLSEPPGEPADRAPTRPACGAPLPSQP